jgi:CRISPR-associated protein Cas5h
MKIVSFGIRGRFGHFLKAEGGVSAMSYPVPPRTAILGMAGAVLGLEKDQPQQALEPAGIALGGRLPRTFWHKAKLRKDPPAPLPREVNKKQKSDKVGAPEMATLIDQEWLFNPEYTVWMALPEPYQDELESRLRKRRWHFAPCLGMSELSAELTFLDAGEGEPLPAGEYPVHTVFPQADAELDMDRVFADGAVLHSLRMPRAVTPDRVFSHAAYFLERDARPVPVRTEKAVRFGKDTLLWL